MKTHVINVLALKCTVQHGTKGGLGEGAAN